MHDSTSILNLILGSILIGFGFVIPIVALLKTSNLTKLKFKELFILTAVQAVRVAGILYFVIYAIKSYHKYSPAFAHNPGTFFLFDYSFWIHWYTSIMYLLLSQVLWFRKFYTKKLLLVTLALLLIILPSMWFFKIIRSFFISYIPITDSWHQGSNQPLIEFALNIIVFIFIIFTIMLAGNKFKHIKQ